MSPKKCVFGCEDKVTLFNFPKEPSLLARWTQLVFPGQQRRSCANVFVCSRHFTDDCFTNKAQYEAGFAARLNLKAGALPTVEERESKPRVVSSKTAGKVSTSAGKLLQARAHYFYSFYPRNLHVTCHSTSKL